jgi:hypothetical protein
MTSVGQNYYKDLLNFSDKHSKNDQDAIKMDYALQKRLSDYFKNNSAPTLLFSKEYSGMIDDGIKQPLGGPINQLRDGPDNIVGSGFCSQEFEFWDFDKKKPNNIEKQNEIIEKFTNEDYNNEIKENFINEGIQENFDGNTTIPIIIGISVFIIVMLMLFFLLKGKKNPPLNTESSFFGIY